MAKTINYAFHLDGNHEINVYSRISINGREGSIGGRTWEPEELELLMSSYSSALKTCVGVTYNFTYYAMLDCKERLERAGLYRREAKRAYEQIVQHFRRARINHIHPLQGEARWFCVKEALEYLRGNFRNDLGNEEFYDYWQCQGAFAFEACKPMLTSLQWKIKKALHERGVEACVAIGWVEALFAAAYINDMQIETVLDEISTNFGITPVVFGKSSRQFSLSAIRPMLHRVAEALQPGISRYMADVISEHNVKLGLCQIAEQLVTDDYVLQYTIDNLRDHPEIFANKKIWRQECDKYQRMIDNGEPHAVSAAPVVPE